MNDLDRDEQLLVHRLHDRLDLLEPDLAGIVAGATHAGTRIRRRRRVTAGLAGAGCAGLVLGGVFLLPGLGTDRSAQEAGFLAGPAAAPGPEEAPATALPFDLTPPPGWTCERQGDQVVGCTSREHRVDLHWIRIPDDARLADGSIDWAVVDRLTGEVDGGLSTSPRLTWYPWLEYADEASGRAFDGTRFAIDWHETRDPQDLEFTIETPDGWACEEPADEKFGCHDTRAPIPETAQVTVVQRTAEHHAEYLGMKGQGYAVSELHHGYFVSLQPDPDATGAEVQLIADALTWDDGTPVF